MFLFLLLQLTTNPVPVPTPTPKPVASPAMPADERQVEVAGQAYRVRREPDGRVIVRGGDPAVPRNAYLAQRFATAVERVTGCVLRDAFWNDLDRVGKLDCSAQRIP